MSDYDDDEYYSDHASNYDDEVCSAVEPDEIRVGSANIDAEDSSSDV
mgnify:CR=1 FL=1